VLLAAARPLARCRRTGLPSTPGREFQVVLDGPSPLSWDEYREYAAEALESLLDDSSAGEREAQELLETYPCLVPGIDAFEGGDPGPIRSILYSQPLLPGRPTRKPDFMWLPTNSETQWAVLIEIEDPRKLWFTGEGLPRAEYTQAQNQITEWKAILDEPANRQQFINYYDLPGRPLAFKYCLIYGRRKDANQSILGQRRNMRQSDTIVMTYDRLSPREDARDCITAVRETGATVAKFIPATLELSPYFIGHQGIVEGRPEATLRSPHFTDERREFLAERFRYWDAIQATYGHRGYWETEGE
jgi:hypothetical protein